MCTVAYTTSQTYQDLPGQNIMGVFFIPGMVLFPEVLYHVTRTCEKIYQIRFRLKIPHPIIHLMCVILCSVCMCLNEDRA